MQRTSGSHFVLSIGKWVQVIRLEQPEKKRKSREVLDTGLFFTKTKGHSKALLVTYMHHGIQ